MAEKSIRCAAEELVCWRELTWSCKIGLDTAVTYGSPGWPDSELSFIFHFSVFIFYVSVFVFYFSAFVFNVLIFTSSFCFTV